MRLPVLMAIYFLAFFLIGFAHWLDASFDSPTLDQILYHLHYSEGAGVEMSRIFLLTFAMECLAFPLAFAVAAAFLHRAVSRALPVAARVLPVLAVSAGIAV